jgi:heat shock protein HslJ
MNRARVTLLALTLTVGLLVTGAGPALAGDTGSSLRSPVGDWRTRTLGVTQTVTFDDKGRVYGDAGCNRFTGGYTTKGDRMTIGPLASTLRACPQPIMDAEAIFLNKLQSTVAFRATAKKLRLFTPKDMTVYRAN